jgi:hypothetical protein
MTCEKNDPPPRFLPGDHVRVPNTYNMLIVKEAARGEVYAAFNEGGGFVRLPAHVFARGWADWSNRAKDSTGLYLPTPPDDGRDLSPASP